MENKNILYIKPQGSELEKAIINVLNFITCTIYDKLVKDNQTNIIKLQEENARLKNQTEEDNETILDHEFRLMELEG